jgi:hypothetical protein
VLVVVGATVVVVVVVEVVVEVVVVVGWGHKSLQISDSSSITTGVYISPVDVDVGCNITLPSL